LAFVVSLSLLSYLAAQTADEPKGPVLTGQAAFTDVSKELPGVRRHLTVADLPEPSPQQSVDNGPTIVPRPDNIWPIAPKGFTVELYATKLDNYPRLIRTAPNGDIFLAEMETNKIRVFRGVKSDGTAREISVFASGLDLPFGINFYPAGPNPK
jgi:glucose/arabinose dehydrogenase